MDTRVNNRSPIIPLLFGLILGLILAGAFVYLRANFFDKESKSGPSSQIQGLLLSITSPLDGAVVSSNNLKIEGSSGKDSYIVVTGGSEDVVAQTNNGNFSLSVKLVGGENQLLVYAFDASSGAAVQSTLNILQFSETIGMQNVYVSQANQNSQQSKAQLDALKKKLATASSKLREKAAGLDRSHVFGTITSIEALTLTLDTANAGLKTIFLDDLTKYFSLGSGGKTTIEFEALKVGNKVAVIGIGKDDTSGTAKYVIRFNRPGEKRHAVMGKVKSITSNNLVLTHIIQTEREFDINTTASTRVKIKDRTSAKLADVKVGDLVIATGTPDSSGTLMAKMIFVIPGKASLPGKEATGSSTPQ